MKLCYYASMKLMLYVGITAPYLLRILQILELLQESRLLWILQILAIL